MGGCWRTWWRFCRPEAVWVCGCMGVGDTHTPTHPYTHTEMRFIQLTSGTGGFYCGTCLRDNALVTELRRQGHDALLVPLYLPPTLDEAAAPGDAPLFYGGVNVYLQHKASLFRKTPRWVDRLLDAPGLLRA